MSEKVAFIFIRIPSTKNKVFIIKNKNFIDNFFDIVPTVWDVERKEFPLYIWADSVADRDLVVCECSVHVENSMAEKFLRARFLFLFYSKNRVLTGLTKP